MGINTHSNGSSGGHECETGSKLDCGSGGGRGSTGSESTGGDTGHTGNTGTEHDFGVLVDQLSGKQKNSALIQRTIVKDDYGTLVATIRLILISKTTFPTEETRPRYMS